MRQETLNGSAIFKRVNEIEPLVREHADEAARARHLTTPVVDAMRWAGVFRMAMPAAWGGPELDGCTQIEVIERLARADASAAWCAMIGVESGFFASYIDEAAARELYPELDMITAGFQGPAGRLEVCDGGYRLSGRWSFGSGITHADVIVGGAAVFEDGAPRLTPSGRPEHRVAMLPAQHWQVLDTWDPEGLAGSGSHDYTIDETFVPEEYTFIPGERRRPEPLYAWYGMSVACGVGVALGTAAEALVNAREALQAKTSKATMRAATEEPAVRAGLAQAAAMIGSSRSYVYDTLGDIMATVRSRTGALAGPASPLGRRRRARRDNVPRCGAAVGRHRRSGGVAAVVAVAPAIARSQHGRPARADTEARVGVVRCAVLRQATARACLLRSASRRDPAGVGQPEAHRRHEQEEDPRGQHEPGVGERVACAGLDGRRKRHHRQATQRRRTSRTAR